MLKLIALVLNKLNFTTQNFTLDWAHCKAIHGCKLSSPHSKQQSNFLKQVLWFFHLKKDQIKMWYFIKINNLARESHLIYSKTSSPQWLQMPGNSNCTLLKNSGVSLRKKFLHRNFLMPWQWGIIFQPVSNYVNFRMLYTLNIIWSYRQYSVFWDSKSTYCIICNKELWWTAYPKLNMQCYIVM